MGYGYLKIEDRMSKNHVSIDREIAHKCLQYAQTIKGRIETAYDNGLKANDNMMYSIISARDEAEQIEWYLGRILKPDQYNSNSDKLVK